MLPLVVLLLGAASCVSVSTKGELFRALVDVEVWGCAEANGEIGTTFASVCLHLREYEDLGLVRKKI